MIYLNMMLILNTFAFCYKITNFNFLILTGFFAATLLVYVFFHSVLRTGVKKFAFIVLILAVSTLLMYIFKHQVYLYLSTVFNNIVSANDLMYKSKVINFDLVKEMFAVLAVIILMLLFMLCNKGINNVIIFVNIICLILLWYTGYSNEVKDQLFRYVFISLITYCLNSYIKVLEKDKKNGLRSNVKKSEVIFSILLSCLIIGIIQYILPQQIQGRYSSKTQSFFQNKFVQSSDNGAIDGLKYKFDISRSGYSDSDKKLGGPVNIDDSLVLSVKSDKPYYLRGITKEKYDGFSWKKTSKNYARKTEDTSVYDEKKMNGIMDKTSLTIYPDEFKTSTLFAPLYSYNAVLRDEDFYFDVNDKTFIKGNNKPTSYDISFYRADDGKDVLDEKSVKKYDALENYQQYDVTKKYKPYLQVPGNVPRDVYDLVERVTTGANNSAEKAFKIRDYLMKNYKYSLDVDDVPKGKEFVSHFLFDEKKGYCTYFATAATIMCRIADIPARYVEGFNMVNIQDNKDRYEVTNENAHAWTEIMIMPENNLWTILDCVPNAASLMHQGSTTSPTAKKGNTNTQEDPKVKKGEKNKEKVNKTPTKKKKQQVNNWKLYIIPLIMAAFILIRIFIVTLKKIRILKSKSILPLYCYSVKRLEKIGIRIPDNKADMEYFSNCYDEKLKDKMENIIRISYGEYYGNKLCSNFDKKDYYKFIEKYIRSRENIFKYVFKKYFYNY